MWIDQSFDVVRCSESVANLSPTEYIEAIPISFIFPGSVCYDTINITADDIEQGSIGDCWLLSAFGSIATKSPKSITDCIIYDDPTNGYTIIKLRNYHFCVDHWIPVVKENGVIKRLLSPKACQKEYWPIVLEKAFIKLFNSHECPSDIQKYNTKRRLSKNLPLQGYDYTDIHGGFPRWALSVILQVQLDPLYTSNRKDWCSILEDEKNYICIACACTSSEYDDSVTSEGFVYGHAYSIIGTDKENRLIRVRNPWSTYESKIYDDNCDDGEFWVDEETFISKFPIVCMSKIFRNTVSY